MNIRLVIFSCALALLLTGCSRSPIDAKKSGKSVPVNSVNKDTTSLTDKDIFGNETTLSISEEDIQAALDGEDFRIPLNSAIILVQSGNRAPEMLMQQEMAKYYRISTFSGIPDKQKAISCNKPVKNEEQDADVSENRNYMQALRYIAAKGDQKAVIVYWDTLQAGTYDTATKSTHWSDYRNEKLNDTTSLRYLVRFALVDVATGEWATWSPVNYEYSILPAMTGKTTVTDQQITQLRQKTYAAVVKDLVNRYQ
ncbi:hypothetical protein I5462_12515 [Citrobacter freundii]|uniref:hypothetical protein n=1 Tax=Citrobacter freundii TaxID=546 RepID=UPI00122FC783|nr:hypothetical protein [Citrobacter freundii]EJM7592140.1 hypothetical protein [Citrobacter freundii]EKT9309466.1 hypothetical protein [Citrobacter freundii]EKW0740722.1 hypothetical protein [Citrobacter freundii]ELP5235194.1 hypothetical protein [Citrobacter freundii]ELT7645886.1 hypothetical protein [Citrobacter freundii]